MVVLQWMLVSILLSCLLSILWAGTTHCLGNRVLGEESMNPACAPEPLTRRQAMGTSQHAFLLALRLNLSPRCPSWLLLFVVGPYVRVLIVCCCLLLPFEEWKLGCGYLVYGCCCLAPLEGGHRFFFGLEEESLLVRVAWL